MMDPPVAGVTDSAPSPGADSTWPFETIDMLVLSAKITLSAMGIIWTGAHAALRRPPSAAKPKRLEGQKVLPEEDKFAGGFVASDVILFPVMAGTVLICLYYLIKWLEDAAILNKILRVCMSIISIGALAQLSADALDASTNLIFPNEWRHRNGRLYRICPTQRAQYVRAPGQEAAVDEEKQSPLPGWLSDKKFSAKFNDFLWQTRHLLTEEWSVQTAACGVGEARFKMKLTTVLGLLMSMTVAVTYAKTHWTVLSNVLGSSLSYTSLSMLSPTSFGMGTLVLGALLVYDIIMVFYTPYMVTVASTLDVPIKLVYRGLSRSSVLGLGDIVIPGIFIALALRFDLYCHYYAKIQRVPTKLKTEVATRVPEETVKIWESKERCVKTPFVDPRGKWGDYFWTVPLWKLVTGTPESAHCQFSKPYFYASMTGYAMGMLLAMTMLIVFRRGQPALLYLVPFVTSAVWLTGLFRGELRQMWHYTEDGSLDTKDVVLEIDKTGKLKQIPEPDEDDAPKTDVEEHPPDKDDGSSTATSKSNHCVFMFAITASRHEPP